jgi:hypothetical protein
MNKSVIVPLLAMIACIAGATASPNRVFSALDDVQMAQFIDPLDGVGSINFSPDGRYFVVVTERGLLRRNRPQDTISIWNTDSVRQFVLHPNVRAVKPILRVSMATYKDGPIITLKRRYKRERLRRSHRQTKTLRLMISIMGMSHIR